MLSVKYIKMHPLNKDWSWDKVKSAYHWNPGFLRNKIDTDKDSFISYYRRQEIERKEEKLALILFFFFFPPVFCTPLRSRF